MFSAKNKKYRSRFFDPVYFNDISKLEFVKVLLSGLLDSKYAKIYALEIYSKIWHYIISRKENVYDKNKIAHHQAL